MGLKNKVNNILSARGINLAKKALSSEKKLNEVLALPFDPIVQIELGVIVNQIRSLNKGIAELEKTIANEGSKLARKFLGIVYRTLKNKWVFEGFPNFVLAEPAEAA